MKIPNLLKIVHCKLKIREHLRFLWCLFVAGIFLVTFATRVEAARLSFDPVTLTASPSSTFTVRVRVDTTGVATTNSEALITFDSNLLEVTNVAAGDFYPEHFKTIGTGSVRLGGTVTSPTDTRTGTGIISTMTLRAKTTGVAKLTFDCIAGQTTESNVTRANDAVDVIDCTQLVAGTYTLGTAVATTPTTAPIGGASPSGTLTPTPKLPTTGTAEVGMFLGGIGIFAVLVGLALLL